MTEDPRYPVGRFRPRDDLTPADRVDLIDEIDALPARLRAAVEDLSEERLDTPYRPDGWTVRQVVHHLPDSHLNGYVRFKLAATEDRPTIKPYAQAGWAELADGKGAPVAVSLDLLEALHRRWALYLRSLSDDDFAVVYGHPEMGEVSVDATLQLYAWHGRHHLAQITGLRERKGW